MALCDTLRVDRRHVRRRYHRWSELATWVVVTSALILVDSSPRTQHSGYVTFAAYADG